MKKSLLLIFSFVVCLLFSQKAFCLPLSGTAQLPQLVVRENFIQLSELCLQEELERRKENRRYVIECINAPAALRLPMGEITYKVELPNGLRFGRGTQVLIKVFVDGNQYTVIRCSMRVRVYEEVVISARKLKPEVPLTLEDVLLEEREDLGAAYKGYTSLEQVLGKVVIRSVSQGMVLNGSVVKNPILFTSNTPVTIVAEVNGIIIEMEGLSMDRGRRDDIIKVKNISSGRVLKARVIDEHTVKVKA